MSLLINRRHTEGNAHDEVIDLTERLAPYDGCTFMRLVDPVTPASAVSEEPPAWEPLTFSAGYQTVEAPVPAPDVQSLEPTVEEAEPTALVAQPPSTEIPVRKQPRNESCACGSGRKFKRCCHPSLEGRAAGSA